MSAIYDRPSPLKRLIGSGLRQVIADYRLNWIYAPQSPSPAPLPDGVSFVMIGEKERALIEQAEPNLRRAMRYQRAGARGFALLLEGRPVCAVHFADRDIYDHWSTWPLADRGVALVDVVTAEEARGKGLASILIALATAEMLKAATGTFAYVWWSHRSSRRAFRKAGWRPIGFSAEFDGSRGRTFPLRLRFPRLRRR